MYKTQVQYICEMYIRVKNKAFVVHNMLGSNVYLQLYLQSMYKKYRIFLMKLFIFTAEKKIAWASFRKCTYISVCLQADLLSDKIGFDIILTFEGKQVMKQEITGKHIN